MAWWIATVAPSLEFRAVEGLRDAGCETWLPLTAVSRKARHMKRPEWRTYPAYPGYVFVRPQGRLPVYDRQLVEVLGERRVVVEPIGWREHTFEAYELAAKVPELRGILTNAGRPLTLTEGRLSILAERMTCSIVQVIEDAWCIGTSVRITEGPFASFSAIIASALQGERIEVEIELFGRQTPVELTIEQLEKVA